MFDNKLSRAETVTTSFISNFKVRNFCKHIQNPRKLLKILVAKICAFKIKIITHHHMGEKTKFTTSISLIFTYFPARYSREKHYFIFHNTAFLKYCMYRQKHAGSIIVVNNIPNLQWRIYPIIRFSRMFPQPIQRNAN